MPPVALGLYHKYAAGANKDVVYIARSVGQNEVINQNIRIV
jgi:hypothetical protein